jgi:hypothetical protein
MTLYLQKIKLCCEDFGVYQQINSVEDLGFDNYSLWSGNFKKWRRTVEGQIPNFIKFANECQLIFVQRAGRVLGGLILCLQTYLNDYLNLNVKYIVDVKEPQANRKKRLMVGFKTIKVVNQYFVACRKVGFEVVGLDEYEASLNHICKVVKDLKKVSIFYFFG